jgi:hypothetical protein
MITPEQLRAMTTPQRAALFVQLATSFYATERFYTRVVADFDVTKNTVYRWAREGAPFAVIFTLDAWSRGPQAEEKLFADWLEVPQNLNDVTKAMAKLVETTARIARRQPDVTRGASVPHDSGASPSEPAAPLE